MMVTVRDPGGGEGAATRLAHCRAIVAGVLLAVFGVVARGRFGSRLLGCDDGHRLAAERVLDENRPSDHHQTGQPQHAGQPLWRGPGIFGRRLLLIWPRGVFRSSGATARNPREYWRSLARDVCTLDRGRPPVDAGML